MDYPIATVRDVPSLRRQIAEWKAAGQRIALVPTMGALHAGHISLVEQGKRQADRVVVSIFVNPRQFGPKEDFGAYPRQEAADAAKLAEAKADLLFAPTVEAMYPPGYATNISVSGVSEGLCGGARPGHFDGVATVVTKLLLQCLPDIALFGEKDWQQLQVIRRFVTDLDIPVAIQGQPTLREADGLAMSSRNAYLSPQERAVAPGLYRILTGIGQALTQGAEAAPLLAQGIDEIVKAGFQSVDYLELRAAEGLQPLTRADRPARLLVAARLGKARLIDNIPVDPAG